MNTMKRVHLTISGHVQGVCFRASTLETARALKLVGTVQNLPCGGVSVWAEGEGAALEALITWCRRGPPLARVDNMETTWLAPLPGEFVAFSILSRP